MKFKNLVQKLKIWDGSKILSILEEGDSADAKGILVFGKDASGNVIPLRIIAEGDDLTGLEGILSLGKDVNGNAESLSVVADGDSTTELKGIYVFGKDSDGNISPVRIDKESKGLIVISTEHAKIHAGVSFERHIDSNDANVATINVAFKTGPAGEVNLIQGFSASDTVLFEIIEGATWTQGSGTALTISNINRNFGASLLILEDKNQVAFTASNEVIQDVTGVAGGTIFERQLTYQPKQQGGTTRQQQHEWEFKPDTTYILRVTQTSGNCKMSIDLHWYEVE